MIEWLIAGVAAGYLFKEFASDSKTDSVQPKKLENNEQTIKEEDSKDYLLAKKYLADGRNIFITGGAGTGKSYLLRKIKKELLPEMYLTATTGISAVNIGGQTIHSWAGVGKMEKSAQEIASSITANTPLLKQIMMAKYLAIDEISMLSSFSLDKINEVLKIVRENNEPMGGIQTILIGDFFQLPPVIKGRPLVGSDFCFNSRTWKELDLQVILLREVKRQTDLDFIQLLNNIRNGRTKSSSDMRVLWQREEEVKEFLSSPESKDILTLYATNKEAERHNKNCLDGIDSEEFLFKAEDFKDFEYELDGELRVFRRILTDEESKWLEQKEDKDIRIPKELRLKTGCRVMLLKNLDVKNGLANGSCGTVLKIGEQTIEVLFDSVSKPISIMKEETEISSHMRDQRIDVKQNADKIKVTSKRQSLVRRQFPLRVAYGISIHKSQGMTVDKLVVNCANIFADGQAYVALSRVRSLSGLYPKNYDPNKVYVNEDVIKFYEDLVNSEYRQLPEEHKNIQTIIQQAIKNKKKLKIKYQKSEFNYGELSERIVIPQKLDYGKNIECDFYPLDPDDLYLIAFCELRNENRTFKITRIIDICLI